MSTTEERYARAIRSSHLEVKEEARGDVDTIIAAGMAETLGVLLSRLRAEWDAQAGEALQYEKAAKEFNRMADAMASDARRHAHAAKVAEASNAKPMKDGDVRADPDALKRMSRHAEQEAERLRDEGRRELLTGRAMVLMNLTSLGQAKGAIFNFAYRSAPRRGIAGDDPELFTLCGKVLDVWLDRRCHHCEGRGFNGGYRKEQITCGHCRGTGTRRKGSLHSVEALHNYGLWLLNVMDAKSTGAMGQIGRRTRSNA